MDTEKGNKGPVELHDVLWDWITENFDEFFEWLHKNELIDTEYSEDIWIGISEIHTTRDGQYYPGDDGFDEAVRESFECLSMGEQIDAMVQFGLDPEFSAPSKEYELNPIAIIDIKFEHGLLVARIKNPSGELEFARFSEDTTPNILNAAKKYCESKKMTYVVYHPDWRRIC